VIEHVPMAELPVAWRAKLAKAPGATVTVRIKQEEVRTAAPAEEFVADDPAFGIWRDREDRPTWQPMCASC
jgi:predicted RNA methylase